MPRTFVWHRTRGPKTTAKDVPAGKGEVRIEQVRSEIGHSWRIRRTLEALGLKHHQDVVVKQDSESLRGQLKQVRHLIEVSDVEGKAGAVKSEKPKTAKSKTSQGKKRG
jgi:large subunit ribosomal protein L30